MPFQYFALYSGHVGYADAIAALATATVAKRGYLPILVERAAMHDANIAVVAADVIEAELTGDLAPLHQDNFPNALCRHRFVSLAAFRIRGFHMLGESVRSTEGVAGRAMKYVLPFVSGVTNGAGTGDTLYDAYNGGQDLAIGGGASHAHQTGTTYNLCGGGHVRIGTAIPGGTGSLIAVEDATGLGTAGAIRWRGDYELSPGLVQPGYCFWQAVSPLPWEEYEPGVFVQGKFQGTTISTFQRIGQTGYIWDADWEDITLRIDTLVQRHALCGKTSLSELSGSGGRGRYHAQAGTPDWEPWDAVKYFDGSVFTDITGGGSPLSSGAGDGSAVYFISSIPFSNIRAVLSAGATGTHTGAVEYSRGGGEWAAFSNMVDAHNGFRSNGPGADGGNYGIIFNPKADWAPETVDGVTGYAVRWRKTGGSVTGSAAASSFSKRRDAVYIHRWNDAAPVRGATTGAGSGLRWDLNGKSNYEFVNLRICGEDFHLNSRGCAELTLRGVQYACFGDMQFTSGSVTVSYLPSTDGFRYWDQSDIKVLQPSHPIFQDILSKPGADQTKFLDSERWTDLCYCVNGPYLNGAFWNAPVFSGVRIRKVGMKHDTLNDAQAIDLWKNDTPTDHHSFAMRGSFDAVDCTFERMGFEDFLRAIEIYVPANGIGGIISNDDAPAAGACSTGANFVFNYGYHCDWNGFTDSGQPNACFVFSGDNDRLQGYRDGSGDFTGNMVQYWYMKSANDPTAGTAVANSSEIPVVVRDVTVEDCTWAWGISRSFGPEGCITYVEDASEGPSYSDITNSVRPLSGAGTNASMFPAAPAVGDACHFRFRNELNRRVNLTFSQSAVGTFTVVWEYRAAGGLWTQVTNLAGTAAGLTASGPVTFDRPSDPERLLIGGENFFDLRCQLASGSFTTPPVLSTVTSRYVGPAIDIDRYKVIRPGTGVGRIITNRWSGAEANSAFVKDDHMDCTLAPGQSVADDFYKIGSTSTDIPDLTFAEWRALAKSKTNTDAPEDSVFGPNSTMQEAP